LSIFSTPAFPFKNAYFYQYLFVNIKPNQSPGYLILDGSAQGAFFAADQPLFNTTGVECMIAL